MKRTIPTKAGRAVQEFVNDQLSNWYVRLSRRRFWMAGPLSVASDGQMTTDKRAAYETLHECLSTVAQLMSPIAPFYADWLYRNLNPDATSVHLTDFPVVEQGLIDAELERSMELGQQVSSLVHSLRKGHKLKFRQPLSRVLIPVLNADTRRQIEHVSPIVMSEVNVKAVEFVDDASGILKKRVKPNFKALGPKFGKQMKDVATVITAMTDNQLKELETGGQLGNRPWVPCH